MTSMTDVCVTGGLFGVEDFPLFKFAGDSVYNQFARARADDGTQGIIRQILNLPKEDQPDYIRKFDYTGTDYTEAVQEAASGANEFFGTNVEVISADGSLILDSNYFEYLVNAAIASEAKANPNIGIDIPYSQAAGFVSDADLEKTELQIEYLVNSTKDINGLACDYEYPTSPKYSGLLERCDVGDIPVYPWFSHTASRMVDLLYGDFDGVPPECKPGNSESCYLFTSSLNPMNGDYFAIDDYFFVEADQVTALGEDANCFVESYIVGAIASIKLAYLPFCGVGNQNIQIIAAMMGYYFETTGGGKYCGGQSYDFILEQLINIHSKCEFPRGWTNWYTKPCSVCSKN